MIEDVVDTSIILRAWNWCVTGQEVLELSCAEKEFQEALERIWRSQEVQEFSYLMQRHIFGTKLPNIHEVISNTLTCVYRAISHMSLLPKLVLLFLSLCIICVILVQIGQITWTWTAITSVVKSAWVVMQGFGFTVQVAKDLTEGSSYLQPNNLRDAMVQMVLWQAPACTIL